MISVNAISAAAGNSMGLLQRLFSPREKPYLDSGYAFTLRLSFFLKLKGWEGGLPEYTQDEIEAINSKLNLFQQMANKDAGGEVRFHPTVFPEIRRELAAEALEELADRGWKFTEQKAPPEDWRSRISIYLKAWASKPNPQTLLDMAEMLSKAGHKTEAKEALEIVLLFPGYARRYFDGQNKTELVHDILEQARQGLLKL